jgi:hypothetical protein
LTQIHQFGFESVSFFRIKSMQKHHNILLNKIKLIGMPTVLIVKSTPSMPRTASQPANASASQAMHQPAAI